METEKPYLRSDLKYYELAAKLGISVRQLSEVLNNEVGRSFNDFVNDYRVQEVQRCLHNKKTRSHNVLAVAFDAGFSSKASFNRIFKKHTGMTPSQFLSHSQKQPATE